jgi:CIC family chloride channel protein
MRRPLRTFFAGHLRALVGPVPGEGAGDGTGDGTGVSPRRERLRVPAPLLKRRLPSGRGATEQPNAVGDGDAPLNLRFWAALVLTGVAAGLFGDLMMLVLFSVEHFVFGYSAGPFEAAVERSGDLRRVASLLAAGAAGGVLWYLLRRLTKGEKSEVDHSIWKGDGRLSFRRCLGTGLISELVVGMGASIGREQAPKLMGAASGSVLSGWLGLTTAQRRLVVACGAGAGLAAVYNVPLGGTFFTVEILVGSVVLPAVLPAMACSFIATATAWAYLPEHATYVDIPQFHFSATLMVWALVFGPVVGLFASGYIRLMGWVSHKRASGPWLVPVMLAAFGLVGLMGVAYPQLFGNGKDVAHDVFVGHGTLLLLLALLWLKPLATALSLGSGASGGLFTPTLSTGALVGGFLGLSWSQLWPGSPLGAFAMVGAAAMIGASMQAPLAGLALVLELTHSGFSLMVPMIAATLLATAVARYVDGYSIYTARLPAESQAGARAEATPAPAGAGATAAGARAAQAGAGAAQARAEAAPAGVEAARAGDPLAWPGYRPGAGGAGTQAF